MRTQNLSHRFFRHLPLVLLALLTLAGCGGGSGGTAGGAATGWTISATATAAPGTAVPATGGAVQGAGRFADGDTVTLVATPAPGFAFVGWEENGATVATGARYTFTASADRHLTARFAVRHPFVDRMFERLPTLTVAAADFDGDGHADDLLADRIWLNNGRAGFRIRSRDASQRFPAPSAWRATLPLDADGDGDADVLATGVGDAVLYRNDGTGLMQPVADAFGTTPPQPDAAIPAAADLDGDGDTDLVMATGSGTADVWFNDGQGGFSAGQDLGALSGGGDQAQFALADLDADGDPDLVFADAGATAVRIWFNDGRGAFTAATAPSLDNAARVAAGDVDGDGDIDLVFGLASGTAIGLNDGQGGITATVSATLPRGDGGLALGDLDGDGDPDLVVGNPVGNVNNQVWFNDGNGGFGAGPTLEPDLTRSVTVADFDRDGDLDIATANGCLGCATNRSNRLWINDGQGNFHEPVVLTSSYYRYVLAAADIDGDGDDDLVEANAVWRNDGNGVFTRTQDLRTTAAILSIAGHVALGDLDGDGDPDLVVSNTDDTNNTTVWFNDQGTFTRDTGQILTPSDNMGTVVLADVDADGDRDLLVFTGTAGGTTGDLVVWLNDKGAFTRKGTLAGVADYGRELLFADAIDLDGDGDLDVIDWSAGGMGILLNDGKGAFMNRSLDLTDPLGARVVSLRAADFDGDGDPDLVAGYNAGADSRIWLNDGTGNFTDSGRTLAGRSDRNFAVADLDSDGDLDIVNGTAPFHTWINDGQGRFADGGEIRLTATQAFDILFADFNGDGGADLAMAMGRYLSVYHNAIAP